MNIFEKLSIAQQKLIAPKNQYNKFGNYNYRSCEDILEGLKPIMAELKFAVRISDEMLLIGNRYYVKATATFIDVESEAMVSNSAYAREEESVKGMSSSQITGSASSYARKYALNGLFCIDDVKEADSRDNRQKEAEEQKAAEEKQNEIANMKVAEVKVKALASRLATDGIDEGAILKLYKVKTLADLTELQFKNINDHWEDIKKVK